MKRVLIVFVGHVPVRQLQNIPGAVAADVGTLVSAVEILGCPHAIEMAKGMLTAFGVAFHAFEL